MSLVDVKGNPMCAYALKNDYVKMAVWSFMYSRLNLQCFRKQKKGITTETILVIHSYYTLNSYLFFLDILLQQNAQMSGKGI